MMHAAPKIFQVLLLWLAGLGAAGQFAKVAAPFELYLAHYTSNQMGWLLSVVSLVGVFFGMAAGVLVFRFGILRTLVAALLLGAFISWRQSSLLAFEEMLLLRLVEGFSHLTVVVAAPTLIGKIAPARWRSAAMALWSSIFGVAFASVAIFGLPLAERIGLGALLRVHAIWMAVLAVVLFLALCHLKDATDTRIQRQSPRKHLSLVFSPWVMAPALGWLFYATTFVSSLAIVPLLLPPEVKQFTAAVLPFLSLSVSVLLLPFLLIVFSATTMIVTGFLLAMLLAFSIVLGAPVPLAVLPLFAALGLVQGGSFTAIPQLNKTTRGQAFANGAMAQTGNLGNLIGTPLLLLALNAGGKELFFLVIGLLYLAGACGHTFLKYSRKRAGAGA